MRCLGQVISNVIKSRQRRSLFARPTRFDDDDLGCLLQKRYRITHSATGPAGIFPADNDTLSAQSCRPAPPAPDVPASEPPRRRRRSPPLACLPSAKSFMGLSRRSVGRSCAPVCCCLP